jgi:hypothetical protein
VVVMRAGAAIMMRKMRAKMRSCDMGAVLGEVDALRCAL